ncbi:UNVERIFIED_CONTAM: hypothetical protein FKN15_069560 [Acipenser sinensis]
MMRWLLLLLLGARMRQCLLVSTRGQTSTKSHVFYAVEMEGDSRAARALAKQHGLQFISKCKREQDGARQTGQAFIVCERTLTDNRDTAFTLLD